jgi:hypothetical protein
MAIAIRALCPSSRAISSRPVCIPQNEMNRSVSQRKVGIGVFMGVNSTFVLRILPKDRQLSRFSPKVVPAFPLFPNMVQDGAIAI